MILLIFHKIILADTADFMTPDIFVTFSSEGGTGRYSTK